MCVTRPLVVWSFQNVRAQEDQEKVAGLRGQIYHITTNNFRCTYSMSMTVAERPGTEGTESHRRRRDRDPGCRVPGPEADLFASAPVFLKPPAHECVMSQQGETCEKWNEWGGPEVRRGQDGRQLVALAFS
jgi:hypothetical protein